MSATQSYKGEGFFCTIGIVQSYLLPRLLRLVGSMVRRIQLWYCASEYIEYVVQSNIIYDVGSLLSKEVSLWTSYKRINAYYF